MSEIDAPGRHGVGVAAAPHVFAGQTNRFVLPLHPDQRGPSVGEIVDRAGLTAEERALAHAWIGDHKVVPESWHVVRPKPGQFVTITVTPLGGGGGDGGGKSTLSTVITVAAIAASAFVAGGGLVAVGLAAQGGTFAAGGLGASLLSAGIGVAGSLAANAVAGPPTQNLDQLSNSTQRSSPTLSIQGARNEARRFGVIPRVLGRHRMKSPYGATPYTELRGPDEYLRLLFCFGYGPLTREDDRIGNTGLENFDGVELEWRRGYQPDQITDKGSWSPSTGSFPASAEFGDKYTADDAGTVDGVAFEAGDVILFNGLADASSADAWDKNGDQPLTLYPERVSQENLSITLEEADGWSVRTTEADTDEISVDLEFPRGLVKFGDKGGRNNLSVSLEIEYSPAGQNSWTQVAAPTYTARRSSAVRRNERWKVPPGQYDVRIRRTTGDRNDTQIFDTLQWTALRSFESGDPVLKPGMAKVAMAIRATDQLDRIVDTYNAIVQSMVPDYDGSAWPIRPTRNPASLYRTVLQDAANARPQADKDVDAAGLEDWHDRCAGEGFTFDLVVDFETSVDKLLGDIASAGRAGRALRDGQWGVAQDRKKTVPVQQFTPRNSFNFSGEKTFPELPNAFRVRFQNADKDWEADERLVFDDGYDETNATKFETLDLTGITDADLAWRHGRFHIAQARLRPEEFTFDADVEFLQAQRSDFITLNHDVPLFGTAFARVAAVQDDGTDVTAVEMDDVATMVAGRSYRARFRLADGSALVKDVQAVDGETQTLTFVTPEPLASAPEPDDLVSFGQAGEEAADLLIKKVEPGDELTARLTCTQLANAVHDADTGDIPPFVSQISDPPTKDFPAIVNVRSDESVLFRDSDGGLKTRILLELGATENRPLDRVQAIQVQVRPADGGEWENAASIEPTGRSVSVFDVEAGEDYDIRARFRYADDHGVWGPVVTHTVVGKTTPPPDVPTARIEAGVLRWTYPDPPRDFAGFVVRHVAGGRALWGRASRAHDDLLKDTTLDVSALPDGLRTLMIKGVDVAGNESVTPAVVVQDLGDTLVENVIATQDKAAAGYPGTVTGATRSGGSILADTTGTDFWSDDDDADFWSDNLAASFWDADYQRLVYETQVLPDRDQTPAQLKLTHDIQGDPWEIEYRTFGDGQFWDRADGIAFWPADDSANFWPALPAYLPWPGKLTGISRQPYQIRVTAAAGPKQGRVDGLAAKIDLPDLVERFQDVSVAAGGSRLPVSTDFRKIRNVQLTLQDDGGSAVGARVLDKDPDGPLVATFDDADSQVSGLIDAAVQGY